MENKRKRFFLISFFLLTFSLSVQADWVLRVVILKNSLKPIDEETVESALKDPKISKIEFPRVTLRQGVEIEGKQGLEKEFPSSFENIKLNSTTSFKKLIWSCLGAVPASSLGSLSKFMKGTKETGSPAPASFHYVMVRVDER